MRSADSALGLSVCSVALLIVSAGAQVEGPQKSRAPLPIPEVLFIPTPHDIVVRMLHLANVRKDDVVSDLGCGDGRILVTAVQKFGCCAAGFDIDARRVRESLENLKRNRVEDRARVEEKDLFLVDLRSATVITLYLSPKYNVRLIPQLETLRAGSRIVSHQFDMKGVRPDKVVEYPSTDGNVHTLFLWTTPLKKTSSSK